MDLGAGGARCAACRPARLWGPVVGAAVVILVRDALGPGLGGHGELLLGIVFVLVVYLLPRGAAGLAGLRPFRRRRP